MTVEDLSLLNMRFYHQLINEVVLSFRAISFLTQDSTLDNVLPFQDK